MRANTESTMNYQRNQLTALTCFILFLGCAPAFGEVKHSYETSAGRIELVGPADWGAKKLFFNGKLIVEDWSVDAQPITDFIPESGFTDTYLLSVSGGGNACEVTYRWITVVSDELKISDAVGSCSPMVEPPSLVDGKIRLIANRGNGEGLVATDFDGESLTEVNLGLIGGRDVGNAYDPAAWLGRSAYEYINSPDTESVLLNLMSWEERNALSQSVAVGGGRDDVFVQDGDWIISHGCAPHMCGDSFGLVALSVSTGEVFAAYKDWSEGWKFFGQRPEPIPSRIRAILAK